MEIGITTFVENTPDPATGKLLSPHQRMMDLMEEIELADQLASVGLFFYDYKVGFVALYLLSMLHVMLEFPLNFQSFRQIGTEVKMLLLPVRMKG